MLPSMILVQHVKELFDTGQIVPSRDRMHWMLLHHFKGWLRAWPPAEQTLLLETYQSGRKAG
jgi:hypothetical protein